jgi:CheY-like chemotaxis protein
MSKRVLVVDDHEPTRRLIRAFLESDRSQSFRVEEAVNGAECVRVVESRGPFDLVLLDVNLPDGDGFTVCRDLRTLWPETIVVFLSARGDRRSFEEGTRAGGETYLVKPVNRASLQTAARLFCGLERRKAERTAGALP